MPDGLMLQDSPAQMAPDLSTFGDPALEPLHERLVDYGQCWIRDGSPQGLARLDTVKVKGEDDRIVATTYRDPDPDKRPRQWTRPEIEAAGRLHSRIIRLPLVHSLTIQVFYGEASAEYWWSIEPDEKVRILRDLTTWPKRPYGVNPRIAHYTRATQDWVPPIRPAEFLTIMLRGMRILVNSERMLPSA